MPQRLVSFILTSGDSNANTGDAADDATVLDMVEAAAKVMAEEGGYSLVEGSPCVQPPPARPRLSAIIQALLVSWACNSDLPDTPAAPGEPTYATKNIVADRIMAAWRADYDDDPTAWELQRALSAEYILAEALTANPKHIRKVLSDYGLLDG